MEILVFKTNLTSTRRVQQVRSTLNVHPQIQQWNVDLHDCDKVLRIISSNITGKEIEDLLQKTGYYCEELK